MHWPVLLPWGGLPDIGTPNDGITVACCGAAGCRCLPRPFRRVHYVSEDMPGALHPAEPMQLPFPCVPQAVVVHGGKNRPRDTHSLGHRINASDC